MNKTSHQISPAFRSGLSLVLWPFLFVIVGFSFDAPSETVGFWGELVRWTLVIGLLLYPFCFFVGVILNRLKSEEAKEKARFWLGLPWKIIGFCFLAVVIVGFVTKIFGK
jgi:hypothetical protein